MYSNRVLYRCRILENQKKNIAEQTKSENTHRDAHEQFIDVGLVEILSTQLCAIQWRKGVWISPIDIHG